MSRTKALGRNLPDQSSPPNRVRRQLHIVITKPLERLPHAPPFTKFREYQSNGFATSPIEM